MTTMWCWGWSLPAMLEAPVRSLGWEDPLEGKMATDSSVLAWEIPWTKEPGGLQSLGCQRVRYDWATECAHTHTHTPVRDEVCWRWRKATWMMECRWPLKDPKGKEMCLRLEPPARSTVQLTPRQSETQDRILNNCQITYLCHFKLLSSQRFVTAEYWKQRRRVIKRDQEVLRSAGSGRVGCVVSGLFGWGQALVGQLSLITRLGLRCAFLSPDALCRQTAERRVGLSDEGAQCRNPTHLSLSTRLLPRGTEKCFSKDKSYLGSWPVIRGA